MASEIEIAHQALWDQMTQSERENFIRSLGQDLTLVQAWQTLGRGSYGELQRSRQVSNLDAGQRGRISNACNF